MTDKSASISLFPPSFAAWSGSGDPDAREIAVMMSGGVDSSVTAALLRDAGWRVLGVTMKIPVAQACSHPAPCCGADAALVCHRLGIPHYFVEVAGVFADTVIRPFRQAYACGLTPNPCIDCNTFVKFGAVWDLLEAELGIRHAATGHYARVEHGASGHFLARGADAERDQSYFIYGIPRPRLERFHLPLWNRSKDDTRRLAADLGLEVAAKPDSMELCFAGEGDYRNALGAAASSAPGPIVDSAGRRLGTHQGIHNYTLGQRRGLGVAGGAPLFVVALDVAANTVVLGGRTEICRQTVGAARANVLIPAAFVPGARLEGKIRSYSRPAACEIRTVSPDRTEFSVFFAEPQFAPAPGQHLVLYDNLGRVVAGGVIQPGRGN